jgi:hypothetical protein
MAAIAIPLPRALPTLAADLARTRSHLDRLMTATRGREPSEAEARRWDDLDGRRISLEDSFRTEFVRTTGISWEMAAGVMA